MTRFFKRLLLVTAFVIPHVTQLGCSAGKPRNATLKTAPTADSGDAAKSVERLGLAPLVEVGPLRLANKELLLDVQTTDAVSWQWEQLAGPGVITFSSPDTEDTSVTANRDGFYWLRLTVKSTDGSESFDDVQLLWDTVAPCPTLTPELKAFYPSLVNGNVPSDATSIAWKQLSGPGVITYSNALAGETTIAADIDGTYGIRLSATDKVGNICSADMRFIWETTVPTVSVGPDIFTNKEVLIDAMSVEVNSFAWTQVSGPGTLQFSSPTLEDTRVSATTDGDYVIRLTIISSVGLVAFDELNFRWDAKAPTVKLGPDLDRKYRAIVDAETNDGQTYLWQKVSGPGAIRFSSVDTEDTAFITDQAGTYEVSLTVSDLAGNSATDSLLINFEYDVRVFAKEVSSGGSHSCAILDDDSVSCWGYNYAQELGYGDENRFGEGNDRYLPPSFPINLGPSQSARQLSVNYAHSCAILADGNVKCWGQNASGQLGYGDNKKLGVPAATPVSLGGSKARAIATGLAHTCVILEDDSVKCWGANSAGQLGYGDYSSRLAPPLAPINLGPGRSAKSLSLGAYHSCALLDNDSMKCWGNNNNGQLGLADKQYRNRPESAVAFVNAKRVKSIATGAYHSCAILEDSSSHCWGRGRQGQLGYGDLTDRLISESPALNFGASGLESISAGLSHSCAVFADKSVRCWGANDEAQLGTGDRLPRISAAASSPVNFNGAAVTSLSVGRQHSCVLLDDATLRCWGSNSYGQLGAGRAFNEAAPPANALGYGD